MGARPPAGLGAGDHRIQATPALNLSAIIRGRALAWAVIILGITLTRMNFLEDVVYNVDEAEYAVSADALRAGWLPGVDLLGTTKPPGIALLYYSLFEVFGRSMAVIHAASLVLTIGAGLLVAELAIALLGLAAALPAAMLFWMVTSSFNLPSETIALNVETPGILFALAALIIGWKYPRRKRELLLAGVALGMAALFRQSFLAFALPLVGVAIFVPEQRFRRLLFLASGMALPWIPILAWYAAAGGLGWALDSWIRYPMVYAGDLGVMGFLTALSMNSAEFAVQVAVPLAFMIGGLLLLNRDTDRIRARFLYMVFAASLLALFSGSRFFGHYWIQFYPVMAVLGAVAWLHQAKGAKKTRWILAVSILVGATIAALHFPTWRSWDEYAPPRGTGFYPLGMDSEELDVAAFAMANTRPDETIAIWGYCPQIYWHAHRLPGVRDFLGHYITGYSPGAFDPMTSRALRPYGHPDAERLFVEDLARRRPKYVFDLVQIEDYPFTFIQYSLRMYPQLAEYLRAHYLPEGRVGRVLIYRRRADSDTWWPEKQDVE